MVSHGQQKSESKASDFNRTPLLMKRALCDVVLKSENSFLLLFLSGGSATFDLYRVTETTGVTLGRWWYRCLCIENMITRPPSSSHFSSQIDCWIIKAILKRQTSPAVRHYYYLFPGWPLSGFSFDLILEFR